MYTEPQATKPLKGNIFIRLHRKGHRVSIQYCGDCIWATLLSLVINIKKLPNCLMLFFFMLKSYE